MRKGRVLSTAVALLLMAWPSSASAAITTVQVWAVANSSGMSVSKAFGVNTTAGNLLLAACGQGDVGTTTTAPTDTQSNTWLLGEKFTNSGVNDEASVWYLANAPGGALTVQCNFSSATFANHIAIAEFSGIATATPLDVHNTGAATSTAVLTSDVTTTLVNELLVGVAIAGTTSLSYTPGTSWTEQIDTGGSRPFYVEDRIVSSTGTYHADATLSSSAAWTVVIATFKGATGGPCTRTLLGVGCTPPPDDQRRR